MKRPGPPCPICSHPKIAEIDADRRPLDRVSKTFKLARSSLHRHRQHAAKSAAKGEAKPSTPPPTTEREAILDVLARLRASLKEAGADDLPRIGNAITSLGKRLEAIEEGRDVTEADIVKSAWWRGFLGRLEEALRPYPDAARAMARALTEAA